MAVQAGLRTRHVTTVAVTELAGKQPSELIGMHTCIIVQY